MHGRGMCGRGCVWQGACTAGGLHGGGRGVWQGGMHGGGHAWQGVCMVEGACMAGETAIAVGSTHPTGMHSCIV